MTIVYLVHVHSFRNEWENLVVKSVNLELRIAATLWHFDKVQHAAKAELPHGQATRLSAPVACFGTERPACDLGIPKGASGYQVAIDWNLYKIIILVIWNGTGPETESLTFVVLFRPLVAMHLNALVALFALLAVADADDRHARLAKRQATSSTPTTSAASSASSASGSTTTSASGSGSTASSNSTSASPVPTTPVGTTIPPLSQITSGMATPSTLPVTATYPAGATPPISGAPTLPTPCKSASFIPISHLTPVVVFVASQWPPQDQIAPTSTFTPSRCPSRRFIFHLFRRFRSCLVDDGTEWL